MAKTTLFKGVVYLSDEQYAKLIADGVIEVGGQTITYDESMVYVTPKALGGDYYTKEEVEEKLKTVFDNVTYLDNSYGEQSVIYDTDDGITIMQTTRITQGDKTNDISSELTIPLVGSEEIVFDATEDGSHVQAHLDVNITNKLARTIVTPLSIPAATELVAVDNTGSQKMLELGDGLSVENGTLSASGGGSKLYRHNISIVTKGTQLGGTASDSRLNFCFITNSSEIISNYDLLESIFISIGATTSTSPASSIDGAITIDGYSYVNLSLIYDNKYNYVFKLSGTKLQLTDGALSAVQVYTIATFNSSNITSYTDTVTEL